MKNVKRYLTMLLATAMIAGILPLAALAGEAGSTVREAAAEETSFEETSPEETSSENDSSAHALPSETFSGKAPAEDASSGIVLPEGSLPENALSEKSLPEEASSEKEGDEDPETAQKAGEKETAAFPAAEAGPAGAASEKADPADAVSEKESPAGTAPEEATPAEQEEVTEAAQAADSLPAETAEDPETAPEKASAPETASGEETFDRTEDAASDGPETVETPAVRAGAAACNVTLNANGDGYFLKEDGTKVQTVTLTAAEGTEFEDLEFLFPEVLPGGDKLFFGWSRRKNGSLVDDEEELDGNWTLYAVWAEKCTITLNANKGGYFIDYDNGQAKVQTVTYTEEPKGRDLSVYRHPEADPGKIFAGWSTSAAGSALADGSTVTGNMTLYAVWKQGCAVTLDADGGTFAVDGARVSTVTATVEKGTSINTFRFGGVESPEADGKRFLGYSLQKKGDLLPDQGYEVTTDTLTLYAVWRSTCEIVYHAGEGGYFTDLSGGSGRYASYTETLDEGDKVYNTGFIHLVPNSGCTLKGWSLTQNGTATLSSSGYQVGTGTLDLYAVWDGSVETPEVPEEPETFTLTFSANGGTFARAGRLRPTIKETDPIESGTIVSLYDTSFYGGEDPTRKGAEFVGWSLGQTSTNLIPEAQAKAWTVNKNLTVYAVWETTLTFDANGGSFAGGGAVSVEKVRLGSSTEVDLGTYPEPARAEYEFKGWAENPEAETAMPEADAAAYEIEGTTNIESFLYAVWGKKDTELPEVEIPDPRAIADAQISLAQTSLPYSGKEQKPAVTVTDKATGARLKEGTDYTVTYSSNVNAGTASAVITGIGTWTGSVTKTFTITRIAQTFTLKAAASSVETGKTTTVTASGAKETSAYTFSSSDTSVASVSGKAGRGTVTAKKAGTVTITVTTPQTANYKKGTASVTIKVTPLTLKKPQKCRFVKWKNKKYTKCLLRWEKTEGADGYQTLLTWTDGSHAVRKTVKAGVREQTCEVFPNHVSQFVVRAYADTADGRVYSPWSNLEFITPSPEAVTVKKEGSSSKTRKATVRWNIIYGSSGYNVFVTTNPHGTWYWNQSTDVKAGSTSAVITWFRGSRLKKGTRYYVRIVTRRKRNGVFCTVPMPSESTYTGSFKF